MPNACTESVACDRPTLYDDGGCPVCSREMAMYRREPGAEGVHWVDVARCEATDLGPGLTREAAMARLHLRRPDGRLVDGAGAFTSLWQALPRWAWLGRLFAEGLRLRETLLQPLSHRPSWCRETRVNYLAPSTRGRSSGPAPA